MKHALWMTVCLVGCAAVAPPSKSPSPSLVANHVTPPARSILRDACTPTGAELCFNATDDNCNGVIDEGCGEETGLLQFTIAWGESPADVNLVVVTPSLERIPNQRSRATPSGFQFGGDCPGVDGCGGQNVENIYFDGTEPPRGHYSVEIALAELHGADPPVTVHFGARLGGKTLGFDVELSPGENANKVLSFDLP